MQFGNLDTRKLFEALGAHKAVMVTATDTGVGKTYFSTQILKLVAEEFPEWKIAYYKPVQCGRDKGKTDYELVAENHPNITIKNSYFFSYPGSPHYAAELDKDQVQPMKLRQDYEELKSTHDFVVVEGAGGITVPLNSRYLIADMAADLELPVLIATRPDLGTINHSLLTVEFANFRQLELLGWMVSEPSASAYELEDSELNAQYINSVECISGYSSLAVINQI